LHSNANIFLLRHIPGSLVGFVVWLSGNVFDSINEVTLCRAQLVLGWVTARGQVNHLDM